MQIIVHTAACYEWDLQPLGWEPTSVEVARLEAKRSSSDAWLKRRTVERISETSIVIPEDQISSIIDGCARNWPSERLQVVAQYLASVALPHLVPPKSVTRVEVEKAPETERFLNSYFQTGWVRPAREG